MTLAIPAVGDVIILSMEYAADGLSWVRLWDNHALGWLIDETVVEAPVSRAKPLPPAVTDKHAPLPLILGSLAALAPDTSPILSPQWGKFVAPVSVFIPDMVRVRLPDFLTWLATNNGARRPIGSMLGGLSTPLLNGYDQWCRDNADLCFKGEPPS